MIKLSFQSASVTYDSGVGCFRIRIWKIPAVTKKMPKEMICTNNPVVTIISPIFTVLLLNIRPDEPLCIMNERTSPMTNSFVSQLMRMTEWCSPLTDRTIRPSVM